MRPCLVAAGQSKSNTCGQQGARAYVRVPLDLGSDMEFDPSATRTAQRRGYVRMATRGVEGIARRPRPNLRPHAGVTVHCPLLPSGLGIQLKFDTDAVSTGTSDRRILSMYVPGDW